MSTRQVDGSTGRGADAPRPEPAQGGEASVAVGSYHTPWGTGIVVVSEGHLAGVDLPGATASMLLESARPLAGDASSAPADPAALARWVEQLEAYFRGERLAWKPEEIALDSLGFGLFEVAVYTTLLSIPAAATVSYGILAEMAGYPRAARAVGNAMAANPIPVVVPCHRVIRADGSLGRYGDDPAWKERLLTHERMRAPARSDSAAGAEERRVR
jgi:methylated-DNA-[protein]-cysteine S-methyltransferase